MTNDSTSRISDRATTTSEESLNFVVWAGLKSLIGKNSIVDRNIAIFELVKNSIDAHAKNIHVRFLWTQNEAWENEVHAIEILDDWKWMDLHDITNKWLRVAYSAKKDGTEDQEWPPRTSYAGEKGIGRFACDTLGSGLDLYASKAWNDNAEHIHVNWEDFEKDLNSNFQEVPIYRSEAEKDFANGVLIRISKLREAWTRDDLLALKHWLTKLVPPRIKWVDSEDAFRIFLEAGFEAEEDDGLRKIEDRKPALEKAPLKLYYDTVNGEIKNPALEDLDRRTIRIRACVSTGGEYLEVWLFDKEEEIYYFKQSNENFLLRGISIDMSFLDRWAKMVFNKLTGIHSKDFGSIFVYKNGFRIQPYWNPQDDSFGIDLRKAQGHSRFLGNREIMGQIFISGNNDGFMETANRDSGFIKNSAFEQFRNFVIKAVLMRLEKYVRAVKWYGLEEIIEDEDDSSEEWHERIQKVNEDLAKVIADVAKEKRVMEFRYGKGIANIMERDSDSMALLRAVEESVGVQNDEQAKKHLRKVKAHLKDLKNRDKRAKKVIDQQAVALESTSKSLKEEQRANQFLLATSRNAVGISEVAHHLKNYSSGLNTRLSTLLEEVKAGIKDKDFVLKTLSDCILLTARIDKFVRFASVADFDLQASEHVGNVIAYMREYISDSQQNVPSYEDITVEYSGASIFDTAFSPMDVSIVIDNLFSNAAKNMLQAGVRKKIVEIGFFQKQERLEVIFKNHGTVISEELYEKIFGLGFTTTSGGSGLGLHMIRDILRRNGWDITCTSDISARTTSFLITLLRK